MYVDPDGMFGEYYKENGTYLGTDNIDDDKTYSVKNEANLNRTEDNKGVHYSISKSDITDLKVSHKVFIAFASLINAESSGKKLESYIIGNVTMNFLKSGGSTQLKILEDVALYDNKFAQGATQDNLTAFRELNPSQQNSKFALGAAINALGNYLGVSGFQDYANGANGWDGIDLISTKWENEHRNYVWNSTSKDMVRKYQLDNNGGVNVTQWKYKDKGYQISAVMIVGKTLYTKLEGGRGEIKESKVKFK